MDLRRRDFLLGGLLVGLTGCSREEASAAADLTASGIEDGYEAWLRYRPMDASAALAYAPLVRTARVEGTSAVFESARRELESGLSGLLGQTVVVRTAGEGGESLVVGTPETSALIRANVGASALTAAGPDGFVLRTVRTDGSPRLLVASTTDRGALHGIFHLLRLLQTRRPIDALDVIERPAMPLRMVNHWDNFSGSAERGYAGESVFDFEALPALHDRYRDYARMLASTGINGCVVNNVNASTKFLESPVLSSLAPLAALFAAYGIKLYLCANFAAPLTLGGLATASPFDVGVQAWWDTKIAEIYATIPGFGGLLVKASSEGQPGPIDYGATHADGANLLARALAKHGDGIVIWRAFVWRESDDRAKVAFEEFQPLDGTFEKNAIVQIKTGPLDFQIREAPHPLFGKLPRTASMLEVQLTQEYTGQTTHLCYLVPQSKEVLDFDTCVSGPGSTISKVVDGSLDGHAQAGMAGVRNVGSVRNWTGHPLAAANAYGFGRLAWSPALTSESIAEEWTRMTFGNDANVVAEIVSLLIQSPSAYELYTSPLGSGFMCEGGSHYEPNPADKHYYHRADDRTASQGGVGFDRVATGYAGLYDARVAARFGSRDACPEELLLFFHHVPYVSRLSSGKTVIQHIYDSHFDGVERVRDMRERWKILAGSVDAARHRDVLQRFDAQLAHAAVWRDSIVGYFFHMSGVLDEQREWVAVQRISMPPTVAAGTPAAVTIALTNATAAAVAIEVRVDTAGGWSGASAARISAGESATISVPVIPAANAPVFLITARKSENESVTVLGPTFAQYVSPAGHLRPWAPG